MSALTRLGWTPSLESVFEPHAAAGCVPGRVSVQHRTAYVVLTDSGERWAQASGRLRHQAADPASLPVVGDWVALRDIGDSGAATIATVLPRRTAFSRRAPGEAALEQVVAANVDTVLVVSAFGHDLNPRRIERYVVAVWEGGAEPVIVLNKSDLTDDSGPAVALVEQVAIGVPVHPVSCATGDGLERLAVYLREGRTVALLGSSGVGKTSLVNRLAGGAHRPTQEVRHDGRGRHTTTRRELVMVPGGGLLLDTPGMRELGLWNAESGLADVFDDVAALAADCRFGDCRHDREPGCAVLAAVAGGQLPAARLESFHKLERELAYGELKRNERMRSEERRERRRFAPSLRRDAW